MKIKTEKTENRRQKTEDKMAEESDETGGTRGGSGPGWGARRVNGGVVDRKPMCCMYCTTTSFKTK